MRPPLLLLCLIAIALSACASLPRTPYSEREAARATIVGLPADIRFDADAPVEEIGPVLARAEERSRRQGGGTLLALSGGADDGAYGAGFLVGWSATGQRPEFTVVSGISTGALIAPYAFLGPAYDDDLRRSFTTIQSSDIFVFQGLRGLFGAAIADSRPLRELVARQVTPELLAAIAAEHAKGRVLLVATTDLDAQKTIVWNLGRIAEIGTPRALEVFRDVLVASASVPAIFPPVLFAAQADGERFSELHVDGGATTQVFTLPSAVLLGAGRRAPPGSHIYMVINNTLEPDFEVVEAGTIPIASRSFSTLIKASARQTVAQTYDFAREQDIGFSLTAIGQDFDRPYDGPFDRAYMTALFEYGRARGASGEGWVTRPPFLD